MQTTTNNTTASATTTTTQQVQNQQQSPFRKVDPVQDLLYLKKEEERSSRRGKLLKIKEALLDEGHHFKEGFLDSIGVDKKYSDRVRVKFSVNTEDEFIADATFDSVQLSKFNSGKLDFSSDKFGWSPIVENTMNLWVKTIFMEAKKWLDYEDSRKAELLTEFGGPNGIVDSENHLRKELCDDIIGGDDLRTNILITPIIDGENRLVLNASYKGIPVTGFRSNPFNFLSDSYGNSVTEKDIEGWLGAVAKDIMNIETVTTTSPSQQAVSTSQQAVPIAELSPEAQKRKEKFVNSIKITSTDTGIASELRDFQKYYGLERYGGRLKMKRVFDDNSSELKQSIYLDGNELSNLISKCDFNSPIVLAPDHQEQYEKWMDLTAEKLQNLSA